MHRFSLLILFFLPLWELCAQVDTTKNKILNTRVSKEVIHHITRTPKSDTVAVVKSEDAFMPYNGKIVRRITVRRIGFERSIYDSSRTIRNRITKVANSLHSDTREWVIRDNLFIREGRPLNPYRVADNERYLRDLDFILDSKIIVRPVRGAPDSVDLEVVTRDVFSLGITGSVGGIDEYEVGIYDANLFGMGQRLQTNFGVEADREPFVGFEWLYRKSSVAGTLINASFGYTQLDNGIALGEEYEHAFFVRLDRPLVSPYSRLAGGLEVSQNWSKNVYQSSDSLFRRYRYNVEDTWVGYNFGVKNRVKNRSRHFAAVRYFRQHFSRQPEQEAELARALYNDQRFVLGSFTFYNQNFYKTKYVFGFGRTEDVPYGQTLTLTGGWSEELDKKRMYAGASGSKSFVRKSGNFYEVDGGYGTFFNDGKAEDAIVFINGLYFSKLWMPRDAIKLRQQVNGGYAKAFKTRIRELLTLDDELRGFSPDSLYGDERIFLRTETTLFTKWQLAGFRFAPFLSLESAYLRDANVELPQNFFFGTTGGIRVRNENLIFGTIEFRAYYFPSPVDGVDTFAFRITTNVRVKYSGNFVRPPSFVQYN